MASRRVCETVGGAVVQEGGAGGKGGCAVTSYAGRRRLGVRCREQGCTGAGGAGRQGRRGAEQVVVVVVEGLRGLRERRAALCGGGEWLHVDASMTGGGEGRGGWVRDGPDGAAGVEERGAFVLADASAEGRAQAACIVGL